jgi:hypothetical protein
MRLPRAPRLRPTRQRGQTITDTTPPRDCANPEVILGIRQDDRAVVRVESGQAVVQTVRFTGNHFDAETLDCGKYVAVTDGNQVFAQYFGAPDVLMAVNQDGSPFLATEVASNYHSRFAAVNEDGDIVVRDINMSTGKPSFTPWTRDTVNPTDLAYCGETIAYIDGGSLYTASHNGQGQPSNWGSAVPGGTIEFNHDCNLVVFQRFETAKTTMELNRTSGEIVAIEEDGYAVEIDPSGAVNEFGSFDAFAQSGNAINDADFLGHGLLVNDFEPFEDLGLDPTYLDWFKVE